MHERPDLTIAAVLLLLIAVPVASAMYLLAWLYLAVRCC